MHAPLGDVPVPALLTALAVAPALCPHDANFFALRLQATVFDKAVAGLIHTYPSSRHLELPGAAASNAWLRAFDWIRGNTPAASFFAIGALAERGALADIAKDASAATQVPSLAPVWLAQVQAQPGWERFGTRGFDRLHAQCGVDWVVCRAGGSR